jgi:hypothetical protein
VVADIQVTVSADHINRGERGSRCGCPIALAVRELMVPGTLVSVWDSSVIIGWHEFSLDRAGIDFIKVFDSTGCSLVDQLNLTLRYRRPTKYFL